MVFNGLFYSELSLAVSPQACYGRPKPLLPWDTQSIRSVADMVFIDLNSCQGIRVWLTDVGVVGIWLGIRGVGSLIGGAINLALNAKDTKTGKVGYTTYLVLIAIQCCGLPLALLLSPPDKVIRDDGTKVPQLKNTTWITEGKAVWKLIRTRRILLLIPVFIVGNWGSVYTSNYFATYFSVRSRALGSFLTAVAGISGDLLTGLALDYRPWSRSLRAKIVWVWLVTIILGLWSWQTTNQVLYDRTSPKLDWVSPGFGRGFGVYILWNFTSESLNTYLYWTMVRIGKRSF